MTKVEIANIALMRLGQERITSLDDPSKPARTISAVWDSVRDELLREHLWNFAMTERALAKLDGEGLFDYTSKFELPSDCLRVVRVKETDDWQVKGRQLYTNTDTATIEYVRRVEDPNEYDSSFAYVFALRLALEVAQSLVGSSTITKQLWDEYLYRLGVAMSVDGQEGRNWVEFDSSWVKAR